MSLNFLDKLQSIHEQANNLHRLYYDDAPDGPLLKLFGHVTYVGIYRSESGMAILLNVEPDNTVEINDLKLLAAELPEFEWKREQYCGAVSWVGEAHGFKVRLCAMEPRETLEAIVFKREEVAV